LLPFWLQSLRAYLENRRRESSLHVTSTKARRLLAIRATGTAEFQGFGENARSGQ